MNPEIYCCCRLAAGSAWRERDSQVRRCLVIGGFIGGPDDGQSMYKHVALLVRQDDMTHEEFVDHWQNEHTPIAREIEGVVRYATVLPTDPENAEFDGIAELYFEDLDKLYDALGSEGSRDYDPAKGKAKEAREDVNNFLAIDERPRFIGQERLVKDETSE